MNTNMIMSRKQSESLTRKLWLGKRFFRNDSLANLGLSHVCIWRLESLKPAIFCQGEPEISQQPL